MSQKRSKLANVSHGFSKTSLSGHFSFIGQSTRCLQPGHTNGRAAFEGGGVAREKVRGHFDLWMALLCSHRLGIQR